jgi:hypothetical protein
MHPSDDMTWGTAGSRGALSYAHLDDAGLCTSTQILTGKKYWVMFLRDPALPDGDPRGDLGSTKWSPTFLDMYAHKFKGYLVAEAIEMVPGTLLCVSFVFCDHLLISDVFLDCNSLILYTVCSQWSTQ